MRKPILWGHHVNEYQAMFGLSNAEIRTRILEYGCGPSAVNATLHHQGICIVSLDPLFNQPLALLTEEVNSLFNARLEQVLQNPLQFDVQEYGGMSAFIDSRRNGLNIFFNDYEQGVAEGRYLEIPEHLPFAHHAFDFALVSHYLFIDTEIQHQLEIIQSLANIANEVRIFPLIDSQAQASPLLGPVLLGLQQANYGVEVREVDYYLYPKGNAMLRVWAQTCSV